MQRESKHRTHRFSRKWVETNVEEVHGVDRDPLVEVLALGQLDGVLQLAAAQGRLHGRLHRVLQVARLRTRGKLTLGLESFVSTHTAIQHEGGTRMQTREQTIREKEPAACCVSAPRPPLVTCPRTSMPRHRSLAAQPPRP